MTYYLLYKNDDESTHWGKKYVIFYTVADRATTELT